MTSVPILDASAFWRRLEAARGALPGHYRAMYSSMVDGIVTDAHLMVVPVDDHMVHRGDAVFETAKFVDGAVYNLDAHLDRLLASAAEVSIDVHHPAGQIRDMVLQTCRVAGTNDGVIRILLSRGPGSLGVNPYDCPESQLYIIVYDLPQSLMERRPDGTSARPSRFAVKFDFLARVKTCNYLLNALMRKEAADHHVDFVFAFDEDGHLAEGPTETVGIVTPVNELHVPLPDRILPGTTMERVLLLAEQLVSAGILGAISRKNLTPEAVKSAREVLIFGTTTDVTAVTQYDGQPVGTGKPGPLYAELRQRLLAEVRSNPEMRTTIES